MNHLPSPQLDQPAPTVKWHTKVNNKVKNVGFYMEMTHRGKEKEQDVCQSISVGPEAMHSMSGKEFQRRKQIRGGSR